METTLAIGFVLLGFVVALDLLLTVGLARRINRLATTLNPLNVPMLDMGEEAPPFEARTLDGQLARLSDFLTTGPTALVFASPSCTPCVERLPELVGMSALARKSGVVLVLVSDSDIEASRAYLEEVNEAMPVLSAPRTTNTLLTDYKVFVTPSYCLVGEDGRVVAAGPMDERWQAMAESWAVASHPEHVSAS